MANIPVGAALEYSQRVLGGLIYEVDTAPVVASVAPALTIVSNNADRVGLIIFNATVNDAFIHVNSSVSSTNGIKVVANGGIVTMNVHDDFTLPARAWYAIMPGGALNLDVIELIRVTSNPAGSLKGQNILALEQLGS